MIYVGAGTSGRIGVQDGVELYPTFNWPKNLMDYIVAGGTEAVLNAVENAVIQKVIKSEDVLIGFTARGDIFFTCKVMKKEKKEY